MTKKDSIPLFLFFIFPFLFLSGTLTSRETFFMRDLTYLFHPWRSLASQMMQSGEMPLWNSYAMGGMPFLANCQSAILYPFTIFFYHFSFVLALKLFHLFHYALAGLGFYLFARKIKLSSMASLIGGVLFAFNGYALTRLEFLSILGSLIWLPWILLFLTSAPNKKRWWQSAITVGIVFSFSLFAGFPQLLILQLLAAGFYFLFCRQVTIKEFLFFLVLSGGIFLFLSAVQWLPTAELLPHSIRGGQGIGYEETGTYSLPIDSLFGLIYPARILHHPDRFTGEKYFWIWSGWWGFVASFLLLVSLRAPRRKILIFGWALFFLGILWSMGNQFDFFKTLHEHFFLFRLFRYPPVALYLTVTGVAILAAFCIPSFKRLFCLNQDATPFRELLPNLPLFIGILMVIELWNYSKNVHPTVIPNYFSVTFPAIQSVIQDKPGTVMLSPKLNQQRRLAGMSSLEAKMRFRAYFFDLTNLPYRIRTLVPCGEPLALKSFEMLYEKLSKTKSVKEATPYFNLWNVTHFLTRDKLKNNWRQIEEDRDFKVYKNPDAFGAIVAIQPEDSETLLPTKILKPLQLKTNHHKYFATFQTEDEKIVLFNVPFYPGWKLFCTSCIHQTPNPHLLKREYAYFITTTMNKGYHEFFLVYQPRVWKISLLLTLLSVGVIALLFFKKSHAYLQR